MNKLQELLSKERFTRSELVELLGLSQRSDLDLLYQKAYAVKQQQVGAQVFFRGLIEFSNICKKNCNYCGIRRDNKNLERYTIPEQRIVELARWAHEQGYGSVVLQSGERNDPDFVEFVARVLAEIKRVSQGELGITLSVGEQTAETYRRWFEAGAHRYLLRIESSNPRLYAELHPADHSWETRRDCLRTLKRIGFQVGTGVMIGLPNQSLEDLADDILFFETEDIDMIGMGPFIPHAETPYRDRIAAYQLQKGKRLDLALRMIAVTRLQLKDVNIAAATALQAIRDDGRELGLSVGANIIMPNLTDTEYRGKYKLYEDKPCLDENKSQCQDCLSLRIQKLGETIGYRKWGDSPHATKKKGDR